jgi:predicted RNase H-like nuclease
LEIDTFLRVSVESLTSKNVPSTAEIVFCNFASKPVIFEIGKSFNPRVESSRVKNVPSTAEIPPEPPP